MKRLISKLVENYFKSLTKEEELTPTVKELKGLLKNRNVEEEGYKKIFTG